MSFVINGLKTLRNNWKKSIFFSGCAVFAVKYGVKKFEDESCRREFCKEAMKYGRQTVSVTQRPKKVTVFLNPKASGGDGRDLFEKNAAPLLHLAGLEVNLVKTEYEGQAKTYMGVIETGDTDAIIVAGGDGTISEVVTGIMRKGDKRFEKMVPIGVIPLGRTNRFYKMLFGDYENHIRTICDATMAVIKGMTTKVDMLRITTDQGNITYALTGLEMGAFRDAEARKSKYWYFGGLKSRWTYIRTIMKQWPPLVSGQLSYTLLTDQPIPEQKSKSTKPTSHSPWSWLNMFYKTQREHTDDDDDIIDDSVNDPEDVIYDEDLDIATTELTIQPYRAWEAQKEKEKTIEVGLGPSDPTRQEILKEGWRRIHDRSLMLGTRDNNQLYVNRLKFIPTIHEGTEFWYNIDGEYYEAMTVEIQLLADKLAFYCPNSAES